MRLLNGWDGYDVLRRAADDAGLHDHYVVFGVAIVPAMLLAWWAMHPALWALGVAGLVLSMVWLVLAPLTALSYLNHERAATLRILWGAEAYLLLAAFLLGIVVAIVAPRRRGIPAWVRVLVGSTALFGIGGTLLGGYYPHATMIGIGVLAALLAIWRPAGSVTPSA